MVLLRWFQFSLTASLHVQQSLLNAQGSPSLGWLACASHFRVFPPPTSPRRKSLGSESESDSESESQSDLKPSKDSVKKMFKQKFCVDGKLMKDDKEVTPQQIKDAFPDINFSGESCNPCDDQCDFEIISSKEKITVEENLRSVDSNSEPVDRTKAITKSE